MRNRAVGNRNGHHTDGNRTKKHPGGNRNGNTTGGNRNGNDTGLGCRTCLRGGKGAIWILRSDEMGEKVSKCSQERSCLREVGIGMEIIQVGTGMRIS